MTREPPLNCVGVTFASSAPWTVSNTSLATFSPSCTKHAPTTVRMAATRSNEPWVAAMRMPSTTGMTVAVRNGRRVARRVRKPNDSRGLTGVPRSADSASKYLRDCGSDRSEYSKNGTSASSQPQAERPVRVNSVGRRGDRPPHRHVPPLVIAVARLRSDVRARQRDLAVCRDGQPGRCRERGGPGGRVHDGLDGDRHGIAVSADPARDLVREGGQLGQPGGRVELWCRAHQAASSPRSVTPAGSRPARPTSTGPGAARSR